ncbi:MAG: arylesterase [Campylobacteraceae bacterium]|jgi:lysophospholipase L1-like esterase|nr:arylesterase [Campylobacteraceae bacterium]
MKKLLFVFCAVILLILFAMRNNNKQDINQDVIILAFGDSITQGYGAKEDESYPSQLSKLLNMKVINSGISGEISSLGLSRLPDVLAEYKPSIVILCHGGNDILRKQDLQITKQNLAKMIELIHENGAKVVLVGVPILKGFGIIDTASFYDELANQYDLIYDDETLKTILKTSSLKSDQIHPNKDGYLVLAQNMKKMLRKNFNLIH